ncbi:MAG TPA: hypothetical protein VE219_00840 [Candidatus Sulfotelmatobacter sp.]|nr:hypothetical protein [Candidatus Sulfotelmatobacter sp.]
MSDSIFLIGESGEIEELVPHLYNSESLLQSLIAAYPVLLSGVGMPGSGTRRWMLLGREGSLAEVQDGGARWAPDHLFVDQEAVLTMIEVRRSTEARIRREVIGQMLDYAANAVAYSSLDTLRAVFERTCANKKLDPVASISALMGRTYDTDQFWLQVRTNLQAGRMRFVFAADKVPAELRRIVEFLNGQMSPAEVFALEVPQYVTGSRLALVPHLIGYTEAANRVKTVGTGQRQIQRNGSSLVAGLEVPWKAEDAQVVRRLMAWAAPPRFSRQYLGKGASDGSWLPVAERAGTVFWPFTVWSSGLVEINFPYMLRSSPFQDANLRRQLRERLLKVPGLAIPEDRMSSRFSFPLALLRKDDPLRAFTSAVEWVLDRMNGASARPQAQGQRAASAQQPARRR